MLKIYTNHGNYEWRIGEKLQPFEGEVIRIDSVWDETDFCRKILPLRHISNAVSFYDDNDIKQILQAIADESNDTTDTEINLVDNSAAFFIAKQLRDIGLWVDVVVRPCNDIIYFDHIMCFTEQKQEPYDYVFLMEIMNDSEVRIKGCGLSAKVFSISDNITSFIDAALHRAGYIKGWVKLE